MTTEVVGGISRQMKGEPFSMPRFSAICTLDGKNIYPIHSHIEVGNLEINTLLVDYLVSGIIILYIPVGPYILQIFTMFVDTLKCTGHFQI